MSTCKLQISPICIFFVQRCVDAKANRFDAYRQHGVSELHWNAIYTGESAVSKSFNFDMMMDMSIPGTVTTLTYQTTRSDAVDGDADDHDHGYYSY